MFCNGVLNRRKVGVVSFFDYFCVLLLFAGLLTHPVFAKPRIGLLATDLSVYEYETEWFAKFGGLATQLDVDLVTIDYNLIYSDYLRGRKSVPLVTLLERELQAKGVNKVIIPGDYYNLDKPPFSPVQNRRRVTDAMVKLRNEGKVSIFAICGGMQQTLDSDGIRIVDLSRIGITESHSRISDDSTNYGARGVFNTLLKKVMINPSSKIASIISDVSVEVTPNGWLVLYLPEWHLEGVDLDKGNLKVLREAGYNIVGFSEDGVIEVLEDKYGNFYFQSHPENLLLRLTQEELMQLPLGIRKSAEAVKKLFSYFVTATV
ncbi:hypothetical protein NHE_0188 [Neorickettsia helminthoeca str. Oregon]|uniref:Glutamine amidotransferase domain-containing protein n=1 Tax=Neorickettsia helminthoeca str. Oregon TaxID=1286528 RepID=X5H372_9RICK|nr:hypothetical protein [Neorickettsia helminthoeca]AHX11153.1 hypothetical protein NHE_0188 [Neorickettsia helminthoeca str. Oregon]